MSDTEIPSPQTEAIVVCDTCGLRSPNGDAFAEKRVGLGRKIRQCPACAMKGQSKGVRNFLAFMAIAFVGAGLLAAFGFGFGWFVLNVLLVQAFMILMAVPHEVGHLLGARSAGLGVPAVIIGVGRRVASFRALGTRWHWNLFPFGGVTIASDRGLAGFRWRLWWSIFTGPAVNAATVALLWWLGVRVSGIGELPQRLMPAWDLAAANAFVLVLNLLPYRHTNVFGQRQGTDGRLLLALPFMSSTELDQQRAASIAIEAELEISADRPRKALEMVRSALERFPDDFHLRIALGLAEIAVGEFEAARRTFESLAELAEEPLPKAMMAGIQAWVGVLIGGDLLEQADRLSEEALEVLPWLGVAQSTRGLVLAATGRPEEGLELLRSALLSEEEPKQRVAVMASMAYANTLLGKVAEADVLLNSVQASGVHSAEIESILAKVSDARSNLR